MNQLRYPGNAAASLVMVLVLAGCFGEKDPASPLVGLASRLYLDGSWQWVDSMSYDNFIPVDELVPHRGNYIIAGTATLDVVDSAAVETYVLSATATLTHIDSTPSGEFANWSVADLQFEDTVEVRDGRITGLAVEPIPPEAHPNTSFIKWTFGSNQLWCTNYLKDPVPVGTNYTCRTVTTWVRDDTAQDSTAQAN